MVRDLIKSSTKGRALSRLPGKGRDLVAKIPEPVQMSMRRASLRSLRVTVEIFAGLLVIAAVLLAIAYGRITQGPVSLAFVVPTLEKAINRELNDLVVKIDDAVIEQADVGAGVRFRLRNIRLIDPSGAVVAQAPLAAIGLSGRALFSGRVAPGSVDFIGPRLLLFYTGDSGLSLTFANANTAKATERKVLRGAVREQTGTGAPAASRERVVTDSDPGDGNPIISSARQIDLTRTITAAFERARRSETASAYLSRFGVRDAVVVFEQDGKQSLFEVPDFAIDLEHGQGRSVLLGEAQVTADRGPWKLNFKTEQSEEKQSLSFTALIQDLVPKDLAAKFPNIPILRNLDMPVTGETRIDLSTRGDLTGAEAKVELSGGSISVPWDPEHPMLIDKGQFHVRYQAHDDRLEILPSKVEWGESKATVSGIFTPAESASGDRVWGFRLEAKDAVLAASEFGLAAMPVDMWMAEGFVWPDRGDVNLQRLIFKAGTAEVEFAGTVRNGERSPEVKLSGRFSPMPLAVLKQIWPKFLASGAREWIGERVPEGRVAGGAVSIDMPAGLIADIEAGGDVPEETVQLDLDVRDLVVNYIPGLPPLQAPSGRVRVSGREFAFSVPTAAVILPSGRAIGFENGSFSIDDLRQDPQDGAVKFDVAGSAESMLELIDQERLGYASEVGIKPSDVSGSASGKFGIYFPLLRDLEFSHLRIAGDLRLEQAAVRGVVEKVKVENGTIDFSITEDALDARGDVLVNGVPALLSWQRIFAAPDDKQPDLRVSAVLDDAQRAELGLGGSHILRGPVPVIVSVGNGADGDKKIGIRADLGNADLILANMGWRKPPGRAAVLSFDVAKAADGGSLLRNFNVKGNDIAIRGVVEIGPDDALRAFSFPELSFNVVTHVSVEGRLREDNVWDVVAEGTRYDGRQFFESLFSAGQLAEDQPVAPSAGPGVDLRVRLGTMLGFFDTTVRDLSIDLKKRGGAISELNAEGKLNGSTPVAVKLDESSEQKRVILAETTDAGAAFRLVGFYPRIEGGQASIQVDLDSGETGRKAGTLWARDFAMLGDRVVREVLSGSGEDNFPGFDNTTASGQSGRRGEAERARVHFNQLRVPFEVGGGQFVLYNSYINGPQLGATLRGQVNFETQEVNLWGTYVPLYGLNSALGSIPILGNLLVGRRGEGFLGITFAIQGTTDNPLVRVNPVSVVAPGIFRQIFEFRGGADQMERRQPEPVRRPVQRAPRQAPDVGTESFATFPAN